MATLSNTLRSRGGAALILMAMLIAGIGICFGLGRLNYYRDQCTRRFERQREIDRMLATRSAVRYVQAKLDESDYVDLMNDGAGFVYSAQSGQGVDHKINVTLDPITPVLHSDLSYGWTPACLGGHVVPRDASDSTIPRPNIAFYFDPDSIVGAWSFLGRSMPVSWVDFPWGLRYSLEFGSFLHTTGGIAKPTLHTGTRSCLLIVGGNLPAGRVEPCQEDIENNPVIRVECRYIQGEESQISAYYSPTGMTSADEQSLTSLPVAPASFEEQYGIQLSGAKIALFRRASDLYAPTLIQYGSLPSGSEFQFAGTPRLYVGARQVAPTNAPVKYSIAYVDIRPPYDWNVVLAWQSAGVTATTTSTVIHAAARSAGGLGEPELVVTYDTHGTDRWPVNRRRREPDDE